MSRCALCYNLPKASTTHTVVLKSHRTRLRDGACAHTCPPCRAQVHVRDFAPDVITGRGKVESWPESTGTGDLGHIHTVTKPTGTRPSLGTPGQPARLHSRWVGTGCGMLSYVHPKHLCVPVPLLPGAWEHGTQSRSWHVVSSSSRHWHRVGRVRLQRETPSRRRKGFHATARTGEQTPTCLNLK